MKPQPMSDAEIDAAAKRLAECMDYPWEFMPEKGRENMRQHARTIVSPTVAARDAQWAAMIGEPVAWALAGSGHSSMQGPALWLRAPTAEEQAMWASFGHPATVSPLYAIKETP